MTKLYVGYLSSPFGLKGEIKVLSDSNFQERIFKKGNTIFVNDKEYIIASSRVIKNNYVVSFENYGDINLIDDLLKKDIYIEKAMCNINKNDYLYVEILDMVIESDIGTLAINDILISKNKVYLKCDKVIIPYDDRYIDRIEGDKKIIYAKNVGDLIL